VSDRRIRPHFHLSVQSLSDTLLERMRRPYTARDVEAAVARLRSVKDDPFIACDIITGFPGEGEAEFAETLAACARIGFAGIHAFPYSRRPGTEAASYKDPVPERLAVDRVRQLMELAGEGRKAYTGRWRGRLVEAVVEAVAATAVADATGGDGTVTVLTENYLRVRVPLRAVVTGNPRGIPPQGAAVMVCL
jgi:threonylcarbamoyladenosine tRNA methylthiotransferase MtaB